LAYEPVFSTIAYLRSLGVDNRISVRAHPDPVLTGLLFETLQNTLDGLQDSYDHGLDPLGESLAHSSNGCLSVEIDGPAQDPCSKFAITWHS
jgi:hypothetical protein